MSMLTNTQAPPSQVGARARWMLKPALGLALIISLLGGGHFCTAQDSTAAGPSAAFLKARESFDGGRWDEAAVSFDRFLDLHPRDKNADAALYWLALALKKQGKLVAADARLERLSREFPRSAWASDARALRVEIAGLAGNVRLVSDAVQDKSDEVKLAALQSLLQLDPARALTVASEILRGDSGAGIKEATIMLLGRHGDERVVPLLSEVARAQADAQTRAAAVRALGQVADPESLDLLKALAADTAEEVSEAALSAAAHLPGGSGTAFIRELAQSDTAAPELRGRAVLTLAQREDDSTGDDLSKVYDTARDAEVRKQTLLALSQMKGVRAQAKLLEIARRESDPELRGQAILGLGQRGDDEGLGRLAALYDEVTDEDAREWIIIALGQSGAKAGAKKLMEVARGEASPRLRQAARLSLERSADPEVKKFLEGFTK